MSLLLIPFTPAPIFTGLGAVLDPAFYAFYPPEIGCVGVPGLPPGVPGVVGSVTDYARALHARSIGDGTAWRITHMVLGVGGHDPVDPVRPLPVDTSRTQLVAEVFRTTRIVRENPRVDSRARSFAAPVGRTEFVGSYSERGLIATILASPYASEIGTQFLYCAVHHGLTPKTPADVDTLRVLVLV